MSMVDLDSDVPVAALIGDMVGSRSHPDRAWAQREMLAALDRVNRQVHALQPLMVTLGDEFQGIYQSLDGAIAARVLMEIELWDVVRLRFGIGWGAIQLRGSDDSPFGQDGPAWHFAREAIAHVKEWESNRPNTVVSAVRGDQGCAGLASRLLPALDLALNHHRERNRVDPDDFTSAAAAGRRERADDGTRPVAGREGRILTALLDDRPVAEIAELEGVSHQAVYSRLGDGLGRLALVVVELMEEANPPR